MSILCVVVCVHGVCAAGAVASSSIRHISNKKLSRARNKNELREQVFTHVYIAINSSFAVVIVVNLDFSSFALVSCSTSLSLSLSFARLLVFVRLLTLAIEIACMRICFSIL